MYFLFLRRPQHHRQRQRISNEKPSLQQKPPQQQQQQQPSQQKQPSPQLTEPQSPEKEASPEGEPLTPAVLKYGVTPTDSDALDEQLTHLTSWGPDIFAIDALSAGRPLTAVTYAIFTDRDLLNCLRIEPRTLVAFLLTLEDHYLETPYHNRCAQIFFLGGGAYSYVFFSIFFS